MNVTIDGQIFKVPEGITVMQACRIAQVEIPHFCYHDKLKIAGNCRMCLVEVAVPKNPKPVASCAMPASDGMVVHTKTESIIKARSGVMEMLLINHPLDCPVCDQGGECDLQDQAYVYGYDRSHFHDSKRVLPEKNMGPLIKTSMTRCIHCTRCVRFMEDIAGTSEIGAFGRGEDMAIETFLQQNISSELSGNIIDLCPVGALTSKPYAFTARSWELKKTYSIDVMDATGSNIRIDSRGGEVMRILPRANEEINQEWLSDKSRFAYDGLKNQRIDSYYIKDSEGKLQEVDADDAFLTAAKIIQENIGNVAGVVGDLVDIETAYVAKKMLQVIKSQYYDCRQDGAALSNLHRGEYIFNEGIAAMSDKDLFLIIGSNIRLEAPVVNVRIREAIARGAKVFYVGDSCEHNYKVTHIGCELADLLKIANQENEVIAALQAAKNPTIIVGQGAIIGSNGSAIRELTKRIAMDSGIYDPFNSINRYNILHRAAGRVGAMDVGFISSECLANGFDCIYHAMNSGKVKVLLSCAADEMDIENIPQNVKIIYIGTHGDVMASRADVILPSACYTEKNALYANTEGRVQMAVQATPKLKPEIMCDAEVVIKISDYLNLDLGFKNIEQLHQSLRTEVPIISQSMDSVISGEFGEVLALETLNQRLKNISFDGLKMQSNIANFYMTDYISRASVTMSKCSILKAVI